MAVSQHIRIEMFCNISSSDTNINVSLSSLWEKMVKRLHILGTGTQHKTRVAAQYSPFDLSSQIAHRPRLPSFYRMRIHV